MVNQKPLVEWLQEHGVHALNPNALQSISRRLAVEGATTNELDLLWNHAIAMRADNPAAMVGIALGGNWKLAVESVLKTKPEHLPGGQENTQYPGDVRPRTGRRRHPGDVYCAKCEVSGVWTDADEKAIYCPQCKGLLVDSKGLIVRDAGPWEGGK